MGSSPAMTKIFLRNFFRLCETFFRKYLKRVHPSFFCLFCKRMDVKKLQKGPILHYLALCDLRETKKNFIFQKKSGFFSIFPQTGTVEENTWHFEVLLEFLSLRYGADWGPFPACSVIFRWSSLCCTGWSTTDIRSCRTVLCNELYTKFVQIQLWTMASTSYTVKSVSNVYWCLLCNVYKTCVFLLVYRPSLLLAVTNVSYRRNLEHFVSIEQTFAPEKSLVRNSPGQMSAQWKQSALNFYGCAWEFQGN